MHLNLFVSNECFMYCKGCYSISRSEKKGTFVPSDDILKFLDFAHGKGVNRITLCGGDPLLRPDIMSLLHGIHEIGIKIALDSVGSLLLKDCVVRNKVVSKLPVEEFTTYVNIVGIPIDGSNDAICRLFRNSNAYSIDDQINICRILHDNGVRVCINTVAHRGNLADGAALSQMVNDFDFIDKWQIFQYSATGKYAKRNREAFEISNEQFAEYCSQVYQISNRRSIIEFKNCEARNNLYLLIDSSGDVWCPDLAAQEDVERRVIVGNIMNVEDWDRISSYYNKA